MALTLAELNAATEAAFVAALGGVFEHSPWVAARACAARPFAALDDLHGAMMRAVRAATAAEQLALVRAHPELAGREAVAGALTADSSGEQGRLGFTALAREEFERVARVNAAYRAKFGFPCIVALARHASRDSVVAAMEARVRNEAAVEIVTAIEEIGAISRHRLANLVKPLTDLPMGRLTTHVLDTAAGRPASGMTIELAVLEGGGWRQLRTVSTNADGRVDPPLLAAGTLRAGEYRLIFHVADYFRACGVALHEPPFLDRVPLHFGIADANAHYHVPLLCSPWSYSTYRGS